MRRVPSIEARLGIAAAPARTRALAAASSMAASSDASPLIGVLGCALPMA